jgi:hypothetical protein
MTKQKFLAVVLLAAGVAHGQNWHEPTDEELKAGVNLGDKATIKTLPNGETWITVHPNGKFSFAYIVVSRTLITGEFATRLVTALPETDVVNGPDKLMEFIQGDCRTRTYQIMGTVTLTHDWPDDDPPNLKMSADE